MTSSPPAFGPPAASAAGDVGHEGYSAANARADHVHDRSTESASTGSTFKWDRFVTVSATDVCGLSYVPATDSCHVYLGAAFLDENTDYTLSGQTVTLLSAAGAAAGDVLTARYARANATDPPVSGGTWTIRSASGIAQQPALDAGAAAGDYVVLFIAADPANTLTTNGWALRATTQVTHAASGNTYTYNHYVLTKTLVGGDTMPALAFVNNNANGYIACRHTGAAAFNSVATTTTADSTTGPSPANLGGNVRVRCWMTISNTGTITAPAGRTALAQDSTGGTDVDLLAFVELDGTAVNATNSVTAGWVAHTVAVVV